MILAAVVTRARGLHPVLAGVLGAMFGGLLMPLPAILWGHLSGHGVWYPVNLLAGMVIGGMDQLPVRRVDEVSCQLVARRGHYSRRHFAQFWRHVWASCLPATAVDSRAR